jgi:hypothetical protein
MTTCNPSPTLKLKTNLLRSRLTGRPDLPFRFAMISKIEKGETSQAARKSYFFLSLKSTAYIISFLKRIWRRKEEDREIVALNPL